jgi:hypothetical protein
VKILKTVKQIQTNSKQNDRKKKNEISKVFRLMGAIDKCPVFIVFGIV